MLWSVRKRKNTCLTTSPQMYAVQKWKLFFFFSVLFWASNVVRHRASTRQRQTPCRMQHHTAPRQQRHPNSPSAFRVPRLKPKQTHLEWGGETRSRQGECPCKYAWFVSRHSGRSGWLYPAQVIYDLIQSLSQVMLSRYWFSERTHPYWCACPLVTKYQGTELFLGGEER